LDYYKQRGSIFCVTNQYGPDCAVGYFVKGKYNALNLGGNGTKFVFENKENAVFTVWKLMNWREKHLLMRLLSNQPSLKSVSFNDSKIEDDGCFWIMQLLTRKLWFYRPNAKDMTVMAQMLGDMTEDAIDTYFDNHPKIANDYMSANILNNDAVYKKLIKSVQGAVHQNGWIVMEDWKRISQSGDILLSSISKDLNKMYRLERLYLQNCEISDTGVFYLVFGLVNSKVKVLQLSKNNLTDKSGLYLGSLLAANAYLEELDVSHNKIGRTGLLAIVQGWKEMGAKVSSLQELDISHNLDTLKKIQRDDKVDIDAAVLIEEFTDAVKVAAFQE